MRHFYFWGTVLLTVLANIKVYISSNYLYQITSICSYLILLTALYCYIIYNKERYLYLLFILYPKFRLQLRDINVDKDTINTFISAISSISVDIFTQTVIFNFSTTDCTEEQLNLYKKLEEEAQ